MKLTPPLASLDKTELSRDAIIYTLQSQWINGVDKGNQISIAKSLIKLRLLPDTAEALAALTGVNAAILKQVATKIQAGDSAGFTQQESDVYGRFDLLLNTRLDQAYQRADQRYRNSAKAAAIPVALVLAIVGALLVFGTGEFLHRLPFAVLAGLVSTPIAPVAKDIASAISTAAQAFQFGKK
ncbi:MAG: hypothetical protein ACM3SW_09290 [Actinomycetota bacterium]